MDTTAKSFQAGGVSAAEDNLTNAASHAAGIALMNAVNAQQQGYVTAAATVTMTVTRILAGQAPAEEATAAKLAAPSPSAMPTPNAVSSEANFAMIAQAWAIAAQDAAAYLRNIEIITSAAIGVTLGTMAHGGLEGDASQAIAAAQSCVGAAVRNLDEICAGAARTMKEFPRAP